MGKKYNDSREMRCVCVDCHDLFFKCDCKYAQSALWTRLDKKELSKFKDTGLVPDYSAELMLGPGDPEPPWVKPVVPVQYDFEV